MGWQQARALLAVAAQRNAAFWAGAVVGPWRAALAGPLSRLPPQLRTPTAAPFTPHTLC
jgi:hypothetical protein